MNIINRLDNYINDKEFKITIINNQVDIVNYSEIINFSNLEISIRYNDKIIKIIGNNLVISKMMEDELLIIGNIHTIIFT